MPGPVLASASSGASSPEALPGVAATPRPAQPAAPAVPPPPYSLPWQLRPAGVGNVVRLDTSIGFYKTPATATAGEVTGGSSVASMLLATYKITPLLAPLVRLGIVENNSPGPTGSGTAFANPVVGMTAGWKLPAGLRLSAILASTVPIGSGGSKTAAQNTESAAINKGAPVRAAMDNAMFAVNYLTLLGGADLAYVQGGFTAQAEVTLFQLWRVRNEVCADGVSVCAKESSRTNATAGLHLGYFILPFLSIGTELRYQQWLKHAGVQAPARENVSFAVGPRFHFKMGPTTWLRPGISYATFIDQPLSKARYDIVQVDLPFAF